MKNNIIGITLIILFIFLIISPIVAIIALSYWFGALMIIPLTFVITAILMLLNFWSIYE